MAAAQIGSGARAQVGSGAVQSILACAVLAANAASCKTKVSSLCVGSSGVKTKPATQDVHQ